MDEITTTQKTVEPQTPPLTVTHILEYLSCPQFTYFEYVLAVPERQERRWKVQRASVPTAGRAWADEKGDSFHNMLDLRGRAATIACGACPLFHQPTSSVYCGSAGTRSACDGAGLCL